MSARQVFGLCMLAGAVFLTLTAGVEHQWVGFGWGLFSATCAALLASPLLGRSR